MELMEEVIKDHKVIRLSAKVKDIDRQYEKNNNCELDNGVYNQLMPESSSLDANKQDHLNNGGIQIEEIRKNIEAKEENIKSDNIEKIVSEKEEAQISLLNSIVHQPLKIGINNSPIK